MRKGFRIELCAALLLAAAGCGKEPQGKFNVVLISIDSLRADHTGPYGHKPEFAPTLAITPNLDRLARAGATFEDAWTTSSWTLPAHMALMTGLTDRAHAVEHDDFALDPLRTTLAEAFRADGYATGGAYSGPFLDPGYGFGRGFDEYASGMLTSGEFAQMVRDQDAERRQRGQPPLQPRDVKAMRDRISHWDVTSPRVNAFAHEFLAQHAAERFFLFLHYFDAHYDFLADRGDPTLPAQFDRGYSGKMHGEDWFFDAQKRVMTWPTPQQPVGQRVIGERDLRHAMALYDAEIHFVDRHVGLILDQLAALGLEEETIVIVTADHGDEFFDHGSIGHRSSLYQELCRIPLIIRVPGSGQSGQRVPHLTRIYDLAPSLLDWCGLPPLAEAQGRSVRSMLETGQGDGRTSLHRIYARFNRDVLGNHNVREGFRDARFSVIRHLQPRDTAATPQGLPFAPFPDPRFGRDFLVYDRVADPRELDPLDRADPRWRAAVDAFCAAWTASETASAALVASPIAMRRSPEKSADQQAGLDALGYVGAADSADEGGRHPPLEPFPNPCLPPP
jgi:arylsulfatase A-like enzyme